MESLSRCGAEALQRLFLFTHCRPIRLRQPAPSSDCRFSNGQGFSTARIHMVRAPDGRRCIRCVELATHAVHIRTPPEDPAASACLIGRHTVRRRRCGLSDPSRSGAFRAIQFPHNALPAEASLAVLPTLAEALCPRSMAIVRTLLLFPIAYTVKDSGQNKEDYFYPEGRDFHGPVIK